MKRSLFLKIFWTAFVAVVLISGITLADTIAVIDPGNLGKNKAQFLDSSLMADTSINFGKFTTESAYNILVEDSQLYGYAWGSSVGWMVMNCVDTTSGCSSTNGNFKVANDGKGDLSGYAWGENTGWINFGPFTNPGISTVKIDSTTGNFGGTLGHAGYAWSQNYGWIIFDCDNPSSCVNTAWRPTTGPTGGGGGGGGGGGPLVTPGDIGIVASSVVCDTDAAMPHWGAKGNPNITADTATDYVANSGGHCQLTAGQSFQWALPQDAYTNVVYGPAPNYVTFGPTDQTGTTSTVTAITTGQPIPLREVLQPGYIPFTYPLHNNNSDPDSAEFYCETDGLNYDNVDYIKTQTSQQTYYCIAFNTPIPVTVTPPGTTDVCPNIDGVQTVVPDGMILDAQGNCVPNVIPPGTTDVCPNIPGVQSSVPTGMVIDGSGNCVSDDRQPPGPPGGGGPTGSPVGIDVTNPSGMTLPPVIVDGAGTVTGAVSALAAHAGLIAKLLALIGLLATLSPFKLWSLLLAAFGFKKRTHPWGTVYDSVTKQPIDPAYVTLMDLNGKEVATSITDIDGRYGFSVNPGSYKIVVNKSNFEFPSKKLAGRTEDELYKDLYFGEVITIEKEGDVITKNIPMDQLNFDWNQFAKQDQKKLSYYHRGDVAVARVSTFLFWIGFAAATITLIIARTTYNSVIFGIYVLFFLIREYAPQFKAKGSITEIGPDHPSSFAILHVMSITTGQEIVHKVADRFGDYYCLVPNGTYRLIVDRKNVDASYTKISVLEPVTVRHGYLKEHIKI